MSSIQKGGEFNKAQYIGESGNQSFYDGYYKASADSYDNTTEVQLCVLPAGAKINKSMAAWSAQGAGGAFTLGWKYKSGKTGGTATAFLASTISVNGGSYNNNYIPNNLTALGSSGNDSGIFDEEVIVYASFSGVALTPGFQFYVSLEGAYMGTR